MKSRLQQVLSTIDSLADNQNIRIYAKYHKTKNVFDFSATELFNNNLVLRACVFFDLHDQASKNLNDIEQCLEHLKQKYNTSI